jgi:hypothetical protein
MIKPFSLQLYTDNDNAKELVIKWLEAKGCTAWVNPDQYGIDLLFKNPAGDYYSCEVEVKHNWKGAKFPFKTMHIPARKLKFAADNAIFVVLNSERTHLIMLHGEDLRKAPIVRKDTIYTEGEYFVEIEVDYE